jgi:hypothetical protein
MMRTYRTTDWKAASEFIAPQLKDNSQVVLKLGWNGAYMLEYYLKTPVKKINNVGDEAIYSNDAWVVVRDGDHSAIYGHLDDYEIQEFFNFTDLRLFHLSARSNKGSQKSLIFKDVNISIESAGDVNRCSFKNGELSVNCYAETWQKIEIKKQTSGNENRVCMFVHPRQGKKIILEYKDVMLLKSVNFFTSIWSDMVLEDRSPAYMDVFIDDHLVKRIIQPDQQGWLKQQADTSNLEGKKKDIKLVVYTDYDNKRHFCFDAILSEDMIKNDYFYRNLKMAEGYIDDVKCSIWQEKGIWPHDEREPPFKDSKIFERWDCEKDLISRSRIWNTIGNSFAISNGEFREAIWFHPIVNYTKSLEYKGMNVSASKIKGYYGLNDLALGKNIEATITFKVYINGKEKFSDKIKFDKGWKEFELDVNGKINDVKFTVDTTNDRWNHFFFNAFIE